MEGGEGGGDHCWAGRLGVEWEGGMEGGMTAGLVGGIEGGWEYIGWNTFGSGKGGIPGIL